MAHAMPIVKDGFSFAGDSLFVEASNHSRHRRATLPELRAILRPTDPQDNQIEDPTGPWYEAQLIHYGLKPSKTKAVAKTRLLDALNKGNLAVPQSIVKLERDLRKEWKKKEKEATTEAKKSKTPTKAIAYSADTTSATATGKKRKNESDDGKKQDSKAKKMRPTTETAASSSKVKGKKSMDKTTPGKATSKTPRASASKPKRTPNKPPNNSRPASQTHRRSRPLQTARKSAPYRFHDVDFLGNEAFEGLDDEDDNYERGNPAIPPGYARKTGTYRFHDDFLSNESNPSEPPPSYETATRDVTSLRSPQAPRSPQTPRSQSLGLLNGRYVITCSDLDQWDMYSGDEFELVLTLDRNALWGAYDFGMFSGVLFIPERPYGVRASLDFTWRGRENSEGEMSFGEENRGWIQFMGGGEIRGMINCYGEARFTGRRIDEDGTNVRSARSMRSEWEGYNQREYDRENRARWGGSGW